MDQCETWWQQFIDQYEMELCVNNSYAGCEVFNDETADALARAAQLHNSHTSVAPEYVIVNMGVNDLRVGGLAATIETKLATMQADANFFSRIEVNSYVAANFVEAYAMMIHRIKAIYPGVEIFTICPAETFGNETINNAKTQVAAAIEHICAHYDCGVVPLHEVAFEAGDTTDDLQPTEN